MGLVPTSSSASTDAADHASHHNKYLQSIIDCIGAPLDSFAGADDDAKLTAAMTYASAQTYKPAIILGSREHQFNTARTIYQGFKLATLQPFPQHASIAGTHTHLVKIGVAGPWLNATSSSAGRDASGFLFGVGLHNLNFYGTNAAASVLANDATTVLYCLDASNISTNNLRHVFGTAAQKLLLTAGFFHGFWEVQASYRSAFIMGGSDNTFWPDGCLLDSPDSLNPTAAGGSGPGTAHLVFDYMDKSTVGPMYITASNNWTGIQVYGPAYNTSGSVDGGPIIFSGLKVEGRNNGDPACNGAVARLAGGITVWRDCWLAYGMADTAQIGLGDAGTVHSSGGDHTFSGSQYSRAAAIAETVPWIRQTAGRIVVSEAIIGKMAGAWAGRPRVSTNGATSIVLDASVTQIP